MEKVTDEPQATSWTSTNDCRENLWARLEAIQRKRDFVRDYRKARRALLAGMPIPFPAGTYWLHRFMGVEVAPFEKMV